jgi:hypothetical protein
MKEKKWFNTRNDWRLFFLIPALALSGVTACSSTSGTAGHNYQQGFADIPPRAYNPESRGYDRPSPFGPESTQQ